MSKKTRDCKTQLINPIVLTKKLALFREVYVDILQRPQAVELFEKFAQPHQQIYQRLLSEGIANGEFPPVLSIPHTSECLTTVFSHKILQNEKIKCFWVRW